MGAGTGGRAEAPPLQPLGRRVGGGARRPRPRPAPKSPGGGHSGRLPARQGPPRAQGRGQGRRVSLGASVAGGLALALPAPSLFSRGPLSHADSSKVWGGKVRVTGCVAVTDPLFLGLGAVTSRNNQIVPWDPAGEVRGPCPEGLCPEEGNLLDQAWRVSAAHLEGACASASLGLAGGPQERERPRSMSVPGGLVNLLDLWPEPGGASRPSAHAQSNGIPSRAVGGREACALQLVAKGTVRWFQGRLGRMSRWTRGAHPCSPTASFTRSS